ncbi:hypothetical protein ACFL9T_23525, partial [Thermodesulfobacteriota bacterium]
MTVHLRILTFIFALVFSLSAEAIASGVTLKQFIGPSPGLKNIYTGLDGTRMELIGISNEKDNTIEIEEVIFFPENILPPDVPKKSSSRYKMIVKNNTLVKQSIKGEEIALQEPFTKNSAPWKIRGKEGHKT